MVEQLIRNEQVTGSSPVIGSNQSRRNHYFLEKYIEEIDLIEIYFEGNVNKKYARI